MKHVLIIACFAMGLMGCEGYPSHLSESEQIQVVVFEHVANQKLGKRASDGSFLLFLGYGEPAGDPSKAVLDYVARSLSSSRPVSKVDPRHYGEYFESGTGKRGLTIYIEPFLLTSDTLVTIKASYHVNGKHAEGFEYRLRRENGQWRVLDRKELWIA